MAHRAMNNREKAASSILKSHGFEIFYSYRLQGKDGTYWAIHPKLICQYCISTVSQQAINDLLKIGNETEWNNIDNAQEKSPIQLTIY